MSSELLIEIRNKLQRKAAADNALKELGYPLQNLGDKDYNPYIEELQDAAIRVAELTDNYNQIKQMAELENPGVIRDLESEKARIAQQLINLKAQHSVTSQEMELVQERIDSNNAVRKLSVLSRLINGLIADPYRESLEKQLNVLSVKRRNQASYITEQTERLTAIETRLAEAEGIDFSATRCRMEKARLELSNAADLFHNICKFHDRIQVKIADDIAQLNSLNEQIERLKEQIEEVKAQMKLNEFLADPGGIVLSEIMQLTSIDYNRESKIDKTPFIEKISTLEQKIKPLERAVAKYKFKIARIAKISSFQPKVVIVDGSNLCFDQKNNKIGFRALDVLIPELCQLFKVIIVFDNGILGALRVGAEALRQRFSSAEVIIAGKDELADALVLNAAEFDKSALVISNDKFSEYREKRVVKEGGVHGFKVLNNTLQLDTLNIVLPLSHKA